MKTYIKYRRAAQDRCVGKEILEIKPIIFGGSPTDPKNKRILDRKQHIAACKFWNKKISEIDND